MKGDKLKGSWKPSSHTLPKFDFEIEGPSPHKFSSTLPAYLLTPSPPPPRQSTATTTPTEYTGTPKPKSPPGPAPRSLKLAKPSEGYRTFQGITGVPNKTPAAPNAAEEPSYKVANKDEITEGGESDDEDFMKGADDFEIVKKGGESDRNGARSRWGWRG